MWVAIIALAILSYTDAFHKEKREGGRRRMTTNQVERGPSKAQWKRYQESDEHSRANRGAKIRAKREIKNIP